MSELDNNQNGQPYEPAFIPKTPMPQVAPTDDRQGCAQPTGQQGYYTRPLNNPFPQQQQYYQAQQGGMNRPQPMPQQYVQGQPYPQQPYYEPVQRQGYYSEPQGNMNHPQPMPQQYAPNPVYPQQPVVPPYYQPQPANYGYQPYPQQPPKVVMTEVQSNGIPVSPYKEEKRHIKRFYNWTGGILLLITAASYLFMIVFSSLSDLIMSSVYGIDDIPYGISQISILVCAVLSYALADIGFVLVGAKITDMKIKPMFRLDTISPSFVVMGAIIAIGMNLCAVLTSAFTNGICETALGFSLASPDDTPITFVYSISDTLYAVIIAPFIEEFVFRGFVLKNLSRFNVWVGIIMSGLLFGFMHGNLYQFIFTVPFGMALAYITVKSNSIVPAILTHMVANAGITVSSLFGQINMDISDGLFGVWVAFFISVGIILFIIALSTKTIGFRKLNKAEKKRGFPLVWASPTILIYIAVCVAEMLISCTPV